MIYEMNLFIQIAGSLNYDDGRFGNLSPKMKVGELVEFPMKIGASKSSYVNAQNEKVSGGCLGWTSKRTERVFVASPQNAVS